MYESINLIHYTSALTYSFIAYDFLCPSLVGSKVANESFLTSVDFVSIQYINLNIIYKINSMKYKK